MLHKNINDFARYHNEDEWETGGIEFRESPTDNMLDREQRDCNYPSG